MGVGILAVWVSCFVARDLGLGSLSAVSIIWRLGRVGRGIESLVSLEAGSELYSYPGPCETYIVAEDKSKYRYC